jgi:hypothetical protein
MKLAAHRVTWVRLGLLAMALVVLFGIQLV